MQEPPHEPGSETRNLLALFADEPAGQRALEAFQRAHIHVEQLQVLPQPRAHPLFTKRIAQWGVLGVCFGAVLGGALGWAFGGLLELDYGLLVPGPYGEALTAAIMGGLMLGMLGLVAGLATGEAKGTHAVSERSRERGGDAEARVARETLLRVQVPAGREAEARHLLCDVGAASVEKESHSRWWDEAA